ncbi:MFS transporter [Streptomyces sp. NPDC047515]|uniref:MFS transporter n=1 Tax=Streptomyces sp. NPDC047515 TaxID=3155380 RepID=UPI0033C28591
MSGGTFRYLATVIDLASRRLAGWAIADHMRADLVIDALHASERTRGNLTGAIFHSDHGAQYCSRAFADACREAGVTQSMSAVGSSADNALAESFNATCKRETLQGRQAWDTEREAHLDLFRRLHRCNTVRRFVLASLACGLAPSLPVLVAALAVFAAGHVTVALGSNFTVLLAARILTAIATGAFWAVANVAATRAAGPAASARALGLVGAGAMLANVVGVPIGAFAGQFMGWRGPFWALAGLAAAAIVLIARTVPHEGPVQQTVSIHSEVTALRSGRLRLVLAACATTTGGVLAAYSYIAPLLTGRSGIAPGLVPLVLVGFGVGAPAGSLVGGRLGDRRPHTVTIVAAAGATLLLLAICLLAGYAVATIVLVTLLGFFGLGANPVLMSLAVRYARQAPVLASALTVSAFNLGTAIGSWIAGLALGSRLGSTGPVVVGTVIAALTLIPTVALAARHAVAAPLEQA